MISFFRWGSSSVVLLLLGSTTALPASERIAAALREKLPPYDPAQYVAPEQRVAPAPAAKASPRMPATAAQPEARNGPEVAGMPVEPGVVELEPFAVREKRVRPQVRLPRLTTPKALRPNERVDDPLLTAQERSARLRRKHLGPVDALLNPPALFGSGRAYEAERREQFAGELQALAGAIELAAAAGETEEELRKLRELYLQLFAQRPR